METSLNRRREISDMRALIAILTVVSFVSINTAGAQPAREVSDTSVHKATITVNNTPTYCNIHGPAATYPGFREITEESDHNQKLKQSWQDWSYGIVDELRNKWTEIATTTGNCDVCPITIKHRQVIVDRKHFYGSNEQLKDEVYSCLQSLSGNSILDLPKGTKVDQVTFIASFSAGPDANRFDWKPASEQCSLFGRPCLPGASEHMSMSLSPPPQARGPLSPLVDTIQSILMRNRQH